MTGGVDGVNRMLKQQEVIQHRQQDVLSRLSISGLSTVRTHYQKERKPVLRPVTTLGLDPVSKRPSPNQP